MFFMKIHVFHLHFPFLIKYSKNDLNWKKPSFYSFNKFVNFWISSLTKFIRVKFEVRRNDGFRYGDCWYRSLNFACIPTLLFQTFKSFSNNSGYNFLNILRPRYERMLILNSINTPIPKVGIVKTFILRGKYAI